MNFKGVQTFWEKSDKFSKILPWLDLHKSEYSWAHLYLRIRVTKQESKRLGLNKKKRVWIWNSNLIIFIIQTKLARISFKLLKYPVSYCLKQCTYYSDTRGVTWSTTSGGAQPWAAGRRRATITAGTPTAGALTIVTPTSHHRQWSRVSIWINVGKGDSWQKLAEGLRSKTNGSTPCYLYYWGRTKAVVQEPRSR
jgi:hypothetical protein